MIEIAIPSYGRADSIVQKTLGYLMKTNFPLNKVTVFVVKEQLEQYKKALKGIGVKIVVGKKTLRKQRDFIRYYYKEGTKMFSLDDDIKGIYSIDGKKWSDVNMVVDLVGVLKFSFSRCEEVGSLIFSYNYPFNPFFLYGQKDTWDRLTVMSGCCYGEIIKHDKYFNCTNTFHEDVERTIKHYHKYGRILKIKHLAASTIMYGGKGGVAETRNLRDEVVDIINLIDRFPQYLSYDHAKSVKKGHVHLKFKNANK